MIDETCDLSKWKLLLRFIKDNPFLAKMIVITACICVVMIFYFCGQGLKEGTKILTEKTIIPYINP